MFHFANDRNLFSILQIKFSSPSQNWKSAGYKHKNALKALVLNIVDKK